MVSPAVLIGPRLKVKRAYRHIDEIIAQTSPLSKDWHSIGMEADICPPYAKPTGFTLRYRPTEPIAELVALMIGDAVHNLRTALDHLATGIRSSSKWKGDAHFPMRTRREELVSPAGQPIRELDLIEAVLPGSAHSLLDKIRPADGADEPLWAFHTLDNDDKHNLILPTVAVVMIDGINVKIGGTTLTDCGVDGDATHPINLIGSDVPFAVKGDLKTVVDVKFGKGGSFEDEPVIPTLTQIAGIVSRTLDEFERLINQSG